MDTRLCTMILPLFALALRLLTTTTQAKGKPSTLLSSWRSPVREVSRLRHGGECLCWSGNRSITQPSASSKLPAVFFPRPLATVGGGESQEHGLGPPYGVCGPLKATNTSSESLFEPRGAITPAGLTRGG